MSKPEGFRHESLNRLGRIVRRELRTSTQVDILRRQERTKQEPPLRVTSGLVSLRTLNSTKSGKRKPCPQR